MNLNSRQKAFLLIVLKQRPKAPEVLIEYVPELERAEMTKLHQELSAHSHNDVSSVALNELKKLSRSKKQSYLTEVHVDWITDLLTKEEPEIIAAVLRYLPAERVNAILNNLPQDVLDKMPKLSDTYAIPDTLVELFRQRFESFFVLDKAFESGQKFEYEHFCLLRADQINQTFDDLGYREIAYGLTTLPQSARKVVLERLSPTDRRSVEVYLNQMGDVSEKRLKRAQFHLISKDVQASRSANFVKALGFFIFAKTLLQRDLKDITVVKKKMSRADVTQLESYIGAQMESNTEASVMTYREDFLVAVKKVLAGKTV